MQEQRALDQELLERLLDSLGPYEEAQPISCSDRSLLSSCWQKAIRRGDVAWALRCADRLLIIDPPYVWRRIKLIALEEVSAANLSLVAETLAIAGKIATRRRAGERTILYALTERLAKTTKCRLPCDLLTWLPLDEVTSTPDVMAFTRTPCITTLRDVAASWKSVAGISVREGNRWRSITRSNPALRDRWLEEAEMSALVQYIVRRGGGTDQLNVLLVPALQVLQLEHPHIVTDQIPPSSRVEIGGVPAYAYCVFSEAGRQALRRLLIQESLLQRYVQGGGLAAAVRTVGYAVFYVEGVVCDQRIETTIALDVRTRASASYLIRHGVASSDVSSILDLARSSLPLLNEMRSQVALLND